MPGTLRAYDVRMADQQHIAIEELLAEPDSVLAAIERDQVSFTLMRGGRAVAVLSPAPVAERLHEIHRTLEEGARDESFYLDVMETRRLLGL